MKMQNRLLQIEKSIPYSTNVLNCSALIGRLCLITCFIFLLISSVDAFADSKSNKFQTSSDTFIDKDIYEKSLIYCVNGVVRELNPQRISRGLTHDVLSPQIYDRLIRNNSSTGSYHAELAERWFYSPDRLKLTFKLREDAAFQTTPWFTPTRLMNADDVIFSFDRLINPNNPFYLDGNYPYFNAISFKKRLKSIHKIDEHTVQFELYEPDSAFIAHLASYYSPILSQEFAQQLLNEFNKHNELDQNELNQKASRTEHLAQLDKLPVGTGAFKYHSFLVDEYVRLIKHTDYWQGEPNIEQLVVDLSASGSGRIAELLAGQCDILAYPAASQLPIIKKHNEFKMFERPSYGTAYLAFNTQKKPLDDVDIRRAIAYAINNERLMASIYLDTAETAGAFLPSYNWAFDPSIQITHFDPEAGKDILKSKGIKKLNLTLSVSSIPHAFNPSPLKMAELIQADLSNIGIDVKIVIRDDIFQRTAQTQDSIDLELVGWNSPNADPDTFLRPVLSCAAIEARTNYAFWCDDDFERYLDHALLIDDNTERKAYYHLAQQALAEELPILPLAYTRNVQVYNTAIMNTELLSSGNFSFHPLTHSPKTTTSANTGIGNQSQ